MKRRELLGPAGAWLAGAAVAAEPTLVPPEPARRRLALALGSGSIHGLAHIGVLRALERLQQPVHAIAGTSAGAIVGALWAAGLSAREVKVIARRFDWNESTRWVLPIAGFKSNDGLQRAIDRVVGFRRIEQLPMRFGAVATDIANGEQVVLARGPVGACVAASSAIPVLFEPWRLDGRDLVDGSLTSPVPVDAARQLGADIVVAMWPTGPPMRRPAA